MSGDPMVGLAIFAGVLGIFGVVWYFRCFWILGNVWCKRLVRHIRRFGLVWYKWYLWIFRIRY